MESIAEKYDEVIQIYQKLNHDNAYEFIPKINGNFLPPDFQQPFNKRLDDFTNILHYACLVLNDLDGFLTNIERDDIIEIYEASSVQYWRSYNFFEKCSYTPEELFFTPWYELFERPDFINEKLMKFVQKVMTEGLSNVRIPVPTHLLKETRGSRNVVELEPRYCSAIYQKNGKLFGTVNTVKAKIKKQKTLLQQV